MKRILSLFLPVLFFLSAQGQTQRVINMPGFQQLGTPSTQTRINGVLYPQVGYAPALYADTVTANANSYLKNIPFAQISTSSDGKNWYRSADATKWNEIGVGTYTAGNGLTLSGSQFKLGGTLTDDSTLVNQDSKRLRFYGNETMFDSLRLTSAGEQDFTIRHRLVGLGFPVTTIKPTGNSSKNIAFDIMPTGTPGNYSDNGIAWLDVCDSDISDGSGAVVAARVGVTTSAVQFGSREFGGATAKPIQFVIGSSTKAQIDASTNTGSFNIGKITQSQSVSGDYVGYTLFNTNNSVAESNAIMFIGNDFASLRFGYIRYNNAATSNGLRLPNQLEIGSNNASGENNGLLISAAGASGKIRFATGTGAGVSNLAMIIDSTDRIGIGTSSPVSVLHTVGTVRHATLGTASTDTTTYKPLGIDTNGDLIPMSNWYGGGGSTLPISSLTAATGTNSINNGDYQQTWNWNSLSGYGFVVQSSATTASNGSRLFYVLRSGTNANAGVTSYSGYFSNSHIGTSSTNIAGLFSAQSGTNNYAIIVPSGGGSVGIGTTTPNASALLDVTSTTQGAVLPRMNTTQMNAISSPVAGLMVYNSDSTSYCYYNGSAWLKMGSGSGGSQDLDNVLTVGNTSTIGAQFGDSVKIQGGTDPFLSFKQATSNQAYRFRVGVGTGLGSQSFSLYDETAAKTRMVMTATGNMLIGGTAAPSAHSRLLVYGGTSGANIDALPDSTDNDESNIEAMGADYYGSSFPGYGVAMQFNGNANTGSILGYSKKNFGQLRFTGETNFVRVVNNRSLRFGINSSEVAVLDSNGRFGIGNNAPTARLDVIGEAGNFTPAIIDGHEDVTGELVNVKQSGSKKFSFHSNGAIEMAETTDPTAAATGYNRLYAQSGKLYTHNDDGRVAQIVQDLQLKFGAGSGADADTTAFTTTALYGDYYTTDTIKVTSLRIVMQGTSPSVTVKIFYNDSLGVQAGATALVTAGNAVTNTTTGTNITSFDVSTIPPDVYVWAVTSTVGTKPKYLSIQLNGYRK